MATVASSTRCVALATSEADGRDSSSVSMILFLVSKDFIRASYNGFRTAELIYTRYPDSGNRWFGVTIALKRLENCCLTVSLAA
jgi:hypothetical protein